MIFFSFSFCNIYYFISVAFVLAHVPIEINKKIYQMYHAVLIGTIFYDINKNINRHSVDGQDKYA